MASDRGSLQASPLPDLGELASRLAPLIENNADLLAVLDYAAGALLCLMEAERYGFKERPGPCEPNYQEHVATAVKEMQDRRMPQAGFWIAGWHFNSALVRIVASYDRAQGALKRGQRRQGHGNPRQAVIEHKHVKIDKIRKEVDSLKHEPDANLPSRGVQFWEALEGLNELVDLIAQCGKRQ